MIKIPPKIILFMNISQKQGFSLIELAIALTIMAILASSIVPIAIRSLQIKAAEKTALEMAMVQQASQNYYNDHNVWPNDIPTLQSNGYLSSTWTVINPWQNPYHLSSVNLALAVDTDVPLQWAPLVASRLPAAVINPAGVEANKNVSSSVLMASGGSSVPSGSIMPLTTNVIPSGWLLCNGQTVSRVTYNNLFNTIGITFGAGDGITTFTLPDLRGRTVVGLDNMGGNAANVITGWSGARVLGGTFGEEKHQLTIGEMPSHHFDIMINDTTSAGGPVRYPETVNITRLKPYPTNTLGNDQPHNVVQPSMAVNWIIKT
jgi:prepilin-type N-terminal cleavage/methylation domain-containing protein